MPPGTLLGGTRIGPRLASGSQGTLYDAVDQASGAARVLKAWRGEDPALDPAAQSEARDRFLADGERATLLRHPGIVRVFGGGISRGVAFIVMERAAGADLTRHTQPDTLLPVPSVLRIAAALASALAFAHRRGVVHSDVKPANVLYTATGDAAAGAVKLVDFGLARTADAAATRSGVFLGSPLYRAPELLAGARPDAASDLYALGVLAFELLAGRPPLEGGSMGELLRAVADEAPRPLAHARPDLTPEQAQALDALLAPLLAKAARDRLADGAAWAERARRLAAQWPITAS